MEDTEYNAVQSARKTLQMFMRSSLSFVTIKAVVVTKLMKTQGTKKFEQEVKPLVIIMVTAGDLCLSQ